MLPKLDKELALTLSCKLTEYFNFVFVDPDSIDQSVAGVERVTLLQLTDSIFRLETEKVKKDILSCSQTYKSLPGLLQLRPDSWMEGRNEVLSHAVGALCQSGRKQLLWISCILLCNHLMLVHFCLVPTFWYIQSHVAN